MIRMKKFVIALLLMVMLLNPSFVFAEAVEENRFPNEIEFLKDLGILPGEYYESNYLYVTKAEYTAFVLKLVHPGLETNGSYDKPFNDVSSDHEYFSQICAAKQLDIISGEPDRGFNPDDDINTLQATVMLVNALGHKLQANSSGGYPSGYINAAISLKLADGVSINQDEISGDALARLLYNALSVELAEIIKIDDDGMQIGSSSGKNLLSKVYGIKKYDVILTDNGISNLYGNTKCDFSQVIFTEFSNGSEIYVNPGKFDFSKYLGYRMNLYVKTDDKTEKKTVISYVLNNNMNILSLSTENVISVSDSELVYEKSKDSGVNRTVYFADSMPVLLFNGVNTLEHSAKHMKPDDGLFTLIDNNGDGKYEILNVLSFNYYKGNIYSTPRNIVVKGIDFERPFINFNLSGENGLDLNSEDYIYKFITNGINSLDDLKEFSIISVAEAPIKIDGKTVYYLAVSDNFINGRIQSAGTDEITIDNETYKISDSILDVNSNLRKYINSELERHISLDVTGKVAFINLSASEALERKYAYVINSGYTKDLEPKGIVKLFNSDETVTVYELSEHVRYNDANEETPLSTVMNDLKADKAKDNLICYELDKNNRISRIYFPESPSGDFEADENKLILSYMTDTDKGERTYRNFGDVSLIQAYVFEIVRDKSTGEVIEDYCSVTFNMQTDSNNYYKGFRMYDAGKSRLAKTALIVKMVDINNDTSIVLPNSRTPCIFDKIVTAVKEDGSVGKKLYYYERGEYKYSFLSSNPTNAGERLTHKKITDLKFGDMFSYVLNIHNEIAGFGVFFSVNDDWETEGILDVHNTLNGYCGLNQIFKGSLFYKGSDTMTIKTKNLLGEDMYYPFQEYTLKCYDINLKTQNIKVITRNDIQISDYDTEAKIITNGMYDRLYDLMVYRNN